MKKIRYCSIQKNKSIEENLRKHIINLLINESSLKTNKIKKVSFGTIFTFFNLLMLRHH